MADGEGRRSKKAGGKKREISIGVKWAKALKITSGGGDNENEECGISDALAA